MATLSGGAYGLKKFFALYLKLEFPSASIHLVALETEK